MAWFKKNRQKAVINFIDLDNDLMSIATSAELTGKTGEPVDYDPTQEIEDLQGKGYVLVRNQFNGNGQVPKYTDDTEVYLISFKHGERKVNPAHPLTKIDSEEYVHPIKFTIKFEGTPTKVRDHVQTINRFRTLTADRITNKRIPNGQFDTDWQLEADKFDDFELPVLPGAHTNKKVIPGPAVGDQDVTITAQYEPNGHLIPVDENGDEIMNVGPYQFASDKDDPTRVAENQIVPDIDGYTHDQEVISPQDPGKDMPVIYKKIPDKNTIEIGDAGSDAQDLGAVKLGQPQDINQPSLPDMDVPDTKQAAQAMGMDEYVNEKGIERRSDEQMAIINFIDLDNNGKQITSSGPLYGLPGEVINNLYSTKVPMKAIERAGFDVVFNNFDGEGQVQKFNNNHLLTQIFTVGLRHKNSKKTTSNAEFDTAELARRQQIVRDKINNFDPNSANNENETAAIITVANATMQLLSMFIDKNQREQEDKQTQSNDSNNQTEE